MNKTKESNTPKKNKKKYNKPTIQSEKLNAYGAVCNGSQTGGRKASTSAVPPCNANRLNS